MANRALMMTPGGATWDVGDAPAGTFTPLEILYHKLHVTLNQSSGAYSYTYLTGSGTYAGGDISGFFALLRAGRLPSPAPLHGTDAPNITVQKSCYVVVELHGFANNLYFAISDSAIQTRDNHQDEYSALYYVASDGSSVPGPTSPSTACNTIYFAVDSPVTNRDDPFNFKCQVMQPTNAPAVSLTIDPALKNRGTGVMSHPLGGP
jgi:hypothetical protein